MPEDRKADGIGAHESGGSLPPRHPWSSTQNTSQYRYATKNERTKSMRKDQPLRISGLSAAPCSLTHIPLLCA